MTVQIARVRARLTSRGQASARQRIDRLLRASTLTPPGLPPAAILIVRRLDDPLPGRLPVDRSIPLPPAVWERAARERMAALYRSAAHPARETVPPGADAVLFSDRAELLACLALDLRHGLLAGAWWWRHLPLPPDRPAPDLLAGQMIDHARYVPAAFELLAEKRAATEIAAWITPRLASDILEAVCEAYGVTLRPTPSPLGESTPPRASRPSHREWHGEQLRSPPPDVDSTGSQRPPEPPWSPVVPTAAIPDSLAVEQQALLGVSLALSRAPSFVRSPDFAANLRAWHAAAWSIVDLPRGDAPQREPEPAEARPSGGPDAGATPPAVPADRPTAQGVQPSSTAGEDTTVASRPGHAVPDAVALAELEDARSLDSWPPQAQIAPLTTRVGGVFYLLNLIITLDLLAAFEGHWRLTAQLGPWGVLDVIARGLLCDQRDVADDALWALLTELAGRDPGQPPGHDFTIPAGHPSPASRIWPGLPDTLPVAEDASRAVDGPLIDGMSADLRSWLRLAIPRISAALASLLAADSDAPDAGEVARLLRTPARIHVTRTHIDIVMALDGISIPARIAGLDRDPGWLPDFGRVVLFHFE